MTIFISFILAILCLFIFYHYLTSKKGSLSNKKDTNITNYLLTNEKGEKFESPSLQDISNTIEALSFIEDDGNSFAILNRDENSYIQTMRLEQEAFHIEYQEGDIKEHFEYKKNTDIKKTISIFQTYLTKHPDWKIEQDWIKMDLEL